MIPWGALTCDQSSKPNGDEKLLYSIVVAERMEDTALYSPPSPDVHIDWDKVTKRRTYNEGTHLVTLQLWIKCQCCNGEIDHNASTW